MRKLLWVIAALMGAIGSVCGQAPARTSENHEGLKKALERFPQADANRDGILTREEAEAFIKKRAEAKEGRQGAGRPEPARADVRYGPHERNVFDLWLPEGASSEKPVPVFVHFHGGGFVAGDKASFDPGAYLKQGYAVVSGNYRFVDGKDVLTPVPMRDAARAIQFIRHKAKEFGIRPDRIAVSGGSAGGVITMWIGYKPDMADPGNEDPVLRESTRVTCLVPIVGPTNLDPRWIVEHIGGGPEVHASLPLFYGIKDMGELDAPEKRALVEDASVINHASADDPPTCLVYRKAPGELPLPKDASQGLVIHHAHFGEVLKQKLDALGVPCEFYDEPGPATDAAIAAFLAKHLKAE